MNMTRICVCCGLLLSWAIASPVAAQAPNSPGFASTGNYLGYNKIDPFGQTQYQVRSDVGSGLGYYNGYQTFGAFQPINIVPNEAIFWINPRGIITYDGTSAANIGAGVRVYDPGTDRILGFGAWYDHDDTTRNKYDQLGLSFESLGKYVDFRTNFYFPSNNHPNTLAQFLDGSVLCTGNSISLGRFTYQERALKGFDFEVGGLLPYIGDYGVRSYVGGFYYDGSTRGADYGVRARAEALFTQDLWGTIAVTHDKLFGTQFTGAVTIFLPGSKPVQVLSRPTTQSRLIKQMERNYRIATVRDTIHDTIFAINPATGLPFSILHVNNLAAPGGDGSEEHPLNFLPTATAPNVDIIDVARGDGTFRNMSNGITLQNNQRLLGDGIAFTISSVQGVFNFPCNVPGGPFPTITNIAGDVVKLASNNEVAGFNITGSPGSGISANGINSFNIHDVNIGNNVNGIQLVNASGTGRIANAHIAANTAVGIGITNTGVPPLNLSMTNVTSESNGTGLSLSATTAAISAVSQGSSFASNGFDGIDLAANAAGRIDLGLAGTNVDSNLAQGINVVANNGQVNLTTQGSSVSGNGSNNLFANLTNGSIFTLTTATTAFNGSVAGSGMALVADNSTINLDLRAGTNISGNAFNGVVADLTTGSIFNGRFDSTLVSGNVAGNGIGIQANNSTASLFVLDGSNISSNGLNGISLHGVNSGQLTAVIDASTVANNRANGLLFAVDGSIGNLTIRNGSHLDSNGLNGINITQLNGGQVTETMSSSSSANFNGADGFHVELNNAQANYTITNALYLGNGGSGIGFVLTNASTLTTAITGSVIGSPSPFLPGNGLAGISINADASNVTLANIVGNDISRNDRRNSLTGGGVVVNATNNSNVTTNVAGNTIQLNGGFGIGVTASNSNAFLLAGGPVRATDANLINNNMSAGIAFTLLDAATGSFTIQNNTIDSTRNRAIDPVYRGEGINVRLVASTPLTTATGVLSNSLIDGNFIGTDATNTSGVGSTVLGNASDGIFVQTTGRSTVQNLLIGNVDATPGNGNFIANNGSAVNGSASGGNGINFLREDHATVNLVRIEDNSVHNNVSSGLFITANGGTAADNLDPNANDFVINNNTFQRNGLNGVHFQVEGNAEITADMSKNLIDSNGINIANPNFNSAGVLVSEIITSPFNLRSVVGDWTKNTITNNGGDGINLSGVTGFTDPITLVTTPLNIGLAGIDPVDGLSLGNLISSNGFNGIQENSFGTQNITNNSITLNGTAQNGNFSRGNGIAYTELINGTEIAVLTGNTIAHNRSDGLAMQALPPGNFVIDLGVTLIGNTISNNDGRGVDVLNQGNASTYLKLGDNTVAGSNTIRENHLEGVYIVNTSSQTQQQHVDSNVALLADGSVFRAPNVVFDAQMNTIQGNGFGTAVGNFNQFQANGIVLRIGTSNSGGSFSTNAVGTPEGQGTTGGMFGGNGRVNARVVNNFIIGNQGVDFYTESFRSTVDPAITAGTWTSGPPPVFIITNYQSDPLARLNLILQGNTATNIQVEPILAGVGISFYNTAEPDFKSRLNTDTPPGPFTSATRRRNATRIQSNGFDVPAPPPGGNFLFSGVGESTFRVEQGFDTVGTGFVGGSTFAIDNEPVPPTFDANGVPFPGVNIFGELPFGWQSVATGTFSFP